ncbi:MAG: hypothetical protein HN976_24335, partial [Lentisphaerae bacterium]|nr:hypothetical protein [Lentisphaerota bacterium]
RGDDGDLPELRECRGDVGNQTVDGSGQVRADLLSLIKCPGQGDMVVGRGLSKIILER